VSGTLFFSADEGSHGSELWKTNGTSSGTALVKDINPGSNFIGIPYSSYPKYLTNVGGILFFSADDGTHGVELWQSNGTVSGTLLVQDINPGSTGSYPEGLTNVGGALFFSANDGTHGFELWDPRVSGTAPPASTPAMPPPAPASPAHPAGALSPGVSAPASPAASPPGMTSWQQAFWLEALLLLADPGAAAPGAEMAWLTILPAGESTLALDLLLAGLGSGSTG
jgi:ELWxxDGT repeat protein